MDKYVITITRQFASLGRSIAVDLSEKLDIAFYDRDIVEYTAKRMNQSIPTISKNEEIAKNRYFRAMSPLGLSVNMHDEIFAVESNIIEDIANKESCIIVGRCANYVLREHERVLNIYIYAPYEARLDNCINVLGMKEAEAVKLIKGVDKARAIYRSKYCIGHNTLYDGYDIMIDSSKGGVQGTSEMIELIVKNKFYK